MSWTFSNPSHLSAGDLTDLDGLAAFSVHAWVKLTNNSADTHAIGKHDGTNGLRLYHDAVAQNGKLKAPKLLVTIGGVSVRAEPSVDNLFTTGVWHSFGGSWKPNDAAGVKVFFDGSEVGSASSTAHGSGVTFPNLAAELYVGRQAASPSQSWIGDIGEVAIWDEILDADEWAALDAGVPATEIRPWALILWSPMKSSAASEWFWRPKGSPDATELFTHSSVSYSSDDDYPQAAPWEDAPEDGEFAPSASPSYSSWEKIAEPTESYRMDTGLQNGLEYQYYVKAVDTSGNPSAASSTVSVTPTAGVQGPPLVIPYPRARGRVPAMRLQEEEDILE